MKTLLTGMTTLQSNGYKYGPKYDYISFTHLLYEMLHELQYDVEWRPFQIGDEHRFDLILCGLSNMRSRICGDAYSILYAIEEAKMLCYVDDWQISGIFKFNVETLFDDFMMSNNKLNVYKENKLQHIIQYGLNKLLFTTSYNILIPKFNFGDINKLILGTTLYTSQLKCVDPSPFAEELQIEIPDVKEKRWVCASLRDRRNNYYGYKWPIDFYFNRKYITENELVTNVYPKNWGIISPSYYHAGSGWWRMRFLHSIWSKSILCASDDEVKDLGNSYMFNIDEVENYSNIKLKELVKNQAQSFYKFLMNKKDTLELLEDYLII